MVFMVPGILLLFDFLAVKNILLGRMAYAPTKFYLEVNSNLILVSSDLSETSS